MRMTLRQWDGRGCPGQFFGPGFRCWRTPSLFHPREWVYHLFITTEGYNHPFEDKYASPTHAFSSFYGLTRYLTKRPDEIEGEVRVYDDEQ